MGSAGSAPARGRSLVLMYHEVERPGAPLCRTDQGYVRYVVTEAELRGQLARVAGWGTRGVSVGELLGQAGPAVLAVTFDDGCESDLLVAAPALTSLGFGATFYVTVQHVGQRGFLSRSQVRELAAAGFEIGSHGLTHRYLDVLSTEEIRRELVESRDVLEQIAGVPVRHLSCPGGRYDRRVSSMAEATGYVSMATSRVGLNPPGFDHFRIAREAVRRGMSDTAFDRLRSGSWSSARRLTAGMRGAARRLLGHETYDALRARLLGDR